MEEQVYLQAKNVLVTSARIEIAGQTFAVRNVSSVKVNSGGRPWLGAVFALAGVAAMKESAVLINVGRGNAIDEAALVEALRSNRLRGAALDVVETEPLPADDPLYSLDNVLISAHSADRTPDFLERATRMFLTNYTRFVRGEPLLNVVDKKAGY